MSVATKRIPWWEPRVTGSELALLKEVLDSNYLNDGEVTARFERAVASRTGAAHAVAVTSGTTAIFLALAAIGVGPEDEVVVPDLTFIATANAVRLTGARVVLADIDTDTLTLDPSSFESVITPRTKAVVPVHVSGRGADMVALSRIAEAHGVAVVEDAAEAFGSRVQGRGLGTFGIAGCLSFSPNKTVTTGQGGAILTSDENVHARLRELKDQGRARQGTGGDDLHPSIGFNFKLTNLQAAVGLAQLTELDQRLERQRRIYEGYARRLEDVPGIRLPGFDVVGGECPLWTDLLADKRDELDAWLREGRMQCRRFWLPIHTQAPYRDASASYPGATFSSARALWLPSAFTLTDQDVDDVATRIRAFFSTVS